MRTTVIVAPAGRGVGITTACLGIVRALDREGIRVGFAKPVANREPDHTIPLLSLGAHFAIPPAVPRGEAEALLAAGDDQTLMERVVAIADKAGEDVDVLIIQGMHPEMGMVHSARVNALMLKALDADLVLVAAPADQTAAEIAETIAIAARGYGAFSDGRAVGAILNRVCEKKGEPGELEADSFGPGSAGCTGCAVPGLSEDCKKEHREALEAEGLRPIAIIPCNSELMAVRVKDVGAALRAQVLFPGEAQTRRVKDVALCAMSVGNALRGLKPGTLVITPGDRNDILLAAAMTVQSGTPLAGIVLTGGLAPDRRILDLCKKVFEGGLPLLQVQASSYRAATQVASMNPTIPVDDADRVERTMSFAADHVDLAWAHSFEKLTRAPRLSPPAFRHRLVETARADIKRIVLPEGAEPRTVAAAAIVAARRIAQCVLLGNPDEIHDVAARQGITLPPSVEIINPLDVAHRYIAPLVERRGAKGMTPDRAEIELQDPIMIGTMMMALNEADGLVSGAIHTTAHTIRPALQIIKTIPGCKLVSSIFFMCLPDQVLVFGDCAVNPNPTASELADIAIQSADSAIAFGVPPRVAMLSYSTGASGTGEDVDKVVEATRIARSHRPELAIDGPLQYDAAIMPDVARLKAPKSEVAGKATVFIFPDLNSGNMTYKAVQRSANVVSIGPMLQGLAKPVNDLSRGCLIEDIVFTINLTAIQAQQVARAKATKG
ncbi:MAG: phosphate acetyltransferase [Thermoanaerobaculia bacterium]